MEMKWKFADMPSSIRVKGPDCQRLSGLEPASWNTLFTAIEHNDPAHHSTIRIDIAQKDLLKNGLHAQGVLDEKNRSWQFPLSFGIS